MLGEIGVEAGNPLPAFAMLGKFPRGGQQLCSGAVLGGLPIGFFEFRLVVECIYVGGAPTHAEKNDPLGFGWKVWRFGGQWAGGLLGLEGAQSGECHVTKTAGSGLEQGAAGENRIHDVKWLVVVRQYQSR